MIPVNLIESLQLTHALVINAPAARTEIMHGTVALQQLKIITMH
jgi:hypothetical protein